MTVTELANRSGATPHAVRYYTRMGLLRAERNPNNGYRLYRDREVGWLRFIRQAKQLGYTLSEIREIMHDSDRGDSPCPRVRRILLRRIEENRRQLEELLALQRRMEQALEQWSQMPDGVPDGHSVCHLIESFNEERPLRNSGGH
ncbi:MAG TPA: MerR family transcriptional regulator [Sedimenticola thiotaurini]|uniref:MerR family transcriptional regulator n=1 Tax=Sedimenticola thiotaurini TaxID=1543721 RepID=A0A831WA66_9GAMM|nr:MerR family transcriptional regulator [Sedimenticola thiotaurini]